MKRYIFIFLVSTALLFNVSCSARKEIQEETVKPVKVLEIKEEIKPVTLDYTGIISAGSMKRLSFKSGGKISRIHKVKGQTFKKGDLLIEQDKEDLELALRASEAQLEAAQAQYAKAVNGASQEEINRAEAGVKKAQDAYDYARDNFAKIETLYKEGLISKSDFDKGKLELEMRESDLKQAQESGKQIRNGARDEDKAALLGQVKQAQANYEQKQSLIEDSAMGADMDGYVVDVLCKEGEMVAAGYPVIVIAGEQQTVSVGVTQKDLENVGIGTGIIVAMGDKKTKGEAVKISKVPDSSTRTYNVEFNLSQSIFTLGAVVNAKIINGEEKGVWIPITAIISNGTDYVFVIDQGKAYKRKVTIEEVKGTQVKVKGLSEGEVLVIEGMKRLIEGDKVAIQK